jgi:hypothetical protein
MLFYTIHFILYYITPHLQITRVWELYSLNRSLVNKIGASISWNKRFSENGGARVDYKHCSSLSRDLNPLSPGSSISKAVIDPFRPSTGHNSQNFQGAVWSPSVGRVTYLPHPPSSFSSTWKKRPPRHFAPVPVTGLISSAKPKRPSTQASGRPKAPAEQGGGGGLIFRSPERMG